MSNWFKKTGEALTNFIKNGGWIIILTVGGFGIALCAIWNILWFKVYGFYWWALIFDIAIWAFCIWAIYKGIVTPIIKHPEYFQVKDMFKKN